MKEGKIKHPLYIFLVTYLNHALHRNLAIFLNSIFFSIIGDFFFKRSLNFQQFFLSKLQNFTPIKKKKRKKEKKRAIYWSSSRKKIAINKLCLYFSVFFCGLCPLLTQFPLGFFFSSNFVMLAEVKIIHKMN
jgi:hypothetical protein